MMSLSSRERKPRENHAKLMRLPWRRIKVWKIEYE